MFTTIAWAVFIALAAASAGMAALLACRFILCRRAQDRLRDLEQAYRTAFSWPIGYDDRPFPSVARAMTVAARERRRSRLALWVEPALSDMREMLADLPGYVLDLCEGVDGHLRMNIDDGSSHEADILDLVDRLSSAVKESRRDVYAHHGAVLALLQDPRYSRFALDGPRTRMRMLANALAADEALCAERPEVVLRHLAAQAVVITECALAGARCTAEWPFIRASWESILMRLDVCHRTFSVLTRWTRLLADDDTSTGVAAAGASLADIHAVVDQMAVVTAVCAGRRIKALGTSPVEELHEHGVASHIALSEAEEGIRRAISRLAAVSRSRSHRTVH